MPSLSAPCATVPTAAMRDGVIQYLCQTNPDGTPTLPCVPATPLRATALLPTPLRQAIRRCPLSKSRLLDSTSLGPHGPDPASSATWPIILCPMIKPRATSSIPPAIVSAPTNTTKNWYIAKLDYNITRDAKQRLSIQRRSCRRECRGCPFPPRHSSRTGLCYLR